MSAHDIYECPADPQEPVRERIRDLLVREPMPDPRAEPFDPRSDQSTRYGWIIAIVGLIATVIVSLL